MEAIITVYWGCLIVGGIFMIAISFLGHMGGHGDIGGHDFHLGAHGADVGHGTGFGHGDVSQGEAAGLSIISPFFISTFLVMFGAVGIACEGAGLTRLIGVPVAGASGMLAAFLAFLAMSKLLVAVQGTSHHKLAEVEGLEATVVTPIPADGIGEVAYYLGRTRRNSAARSSDGEAIHKHATVRIDKVVGSTLLVHEAADERLRRLREDEQHD